VGRQIPGIVGAKKLTTQSNAAHPARGPLTNLPAGGRDRVTTEGALLCRQEIILQHLMSDFAAQHVPLHNRMMVVHAAEYASVVHFSHYVSEPGEVVYGVGDVTRYRVRNFVRAKKAVKVSISTPSRTHCWLGTPDGRGLDRGGSSWDRELYRDCHRRLHREELDHSAR
jgi:hypothetical protein